jgi:hypothetical protein
MHSLYQNPQANVKYLDLTHLTMTRAENLVTPPIMAVATVTNGM